MVSPPTFAKKPTVGRRPAGADNLINWEGDGTGHQAVTVVGGHVLDFRVRWRSNGYSLGSVNHTLSLAPRQIKRVMKLDFERREVASRIEVQGIDDEIDQTTESSRDYRHAMVASLTEWASGESSSKTTGASFSVGAGLPAVIIGGGASHGSAKSSSFQEGEREIAASEEQSLRDALRQHGESSRKMRATVITEIEQSESVQGVSEVIANPNYCHALTVVYYDILRHLRVDTELAGVRECLFIPFSVTPFAKLRERSLSDFDVSRIILHRGTIAKWLKDRKLKWVLPYLEDYDRGFFDSDVPFGRRVDQELTQLRGTVSIRISVASPLSGDEDAEAIEELSGEEKDDRGILARITRKNFLRPQTI